MNRLLRSPIISILLVVATAGDTFAQRTDARALNALFGDEFIAENVRSICRRAADLDPADRYEYLCQWVLPGPDHSDFRVDATLTQTDPSPLALQLDPAIQRSPSGAIVVSPVFDLLDTAAETGQLTELRARVAETEEPVDPFQQRARTALLVLVHLEMREFARAESALSKLREPAALPQPERLHDQWPETLVVYRGLQQLPDYLPVGDLLTLLYSQRTMQRASPAIDEWHTQIVALLEQFQRLGDAAHLKEFVPVVRTRAKSRGPGAAHPRWIRTDDNAVQHVAGHQEEYLLYRSPLRGDFTVECDVGCYGTTDVLAAGRLFGVANQLDRLSTGTFRNGSQTQPFDPPFSKLRDWVRYRAVFQDDTLTVFFNGRLVHEEQLPAHYDPWVGFKGWWRNPARFRDFRISGRPEVPDSVVMSASPELTGWLPYHEDSAGFGGAHWEWRDDPGTTGQIVASRDDRLAGSFCESLLRYQRPLDESGSVEYDFFYEPDAVLGHPALDRLAFILRPDGVRIHWITDAPFDRTQVPPDNLIDELDHRRGPTPLSLRAGEWNHLKLSLLGDVARVELNGEPVFERTIEDSNRRTFGLFHFADQTDVRVRNVVMRGDWREVPSAGNQELADARVAELDAGRDRLPSVFAHDFQDGIPEEHFRLTGKDADSHISSTVDGVFATETSPGTWASVALVSRFSMLGDFDVEASFESLDTGTKELTEGESTILLIVKVDGDPNRQVRAGRTRHAGSEHARGQLFLEYPDGTHRNVDAFLPDESTSGRLRLARRGDTVDMLIAEGDSPIFRIVAEHTGIDGPVPIDGIQLNVITSKLAHCSVVWKDLTLRAEQLQYVPEDDEMRRLYVVGADGSNLRELLAPPGSFTHLGSPEWSADGRLITLDVSTGSTSTSHIFVVNTDDGQATDLGPGCMPSFSKDGAQIAFSQSGIMTMNADGTDRRVIDRSGWGVQFSPDGKYIAYGKSGNITLRNIATGEDRELLRGQNATRYDYVYWNLGWSHDSRSIAFKGRRRDTGEDELAVADVDSPDGFQVLYSTTGSLNVDFTFSPDNEQVLFAMHNPAHKGPQLYLCSRTTPGPPELLPGQPSNLKILDCAWSSQDRIAFAGQRIPQPVNWPPADELDLRSE